MIIKDVNIAGKTITIAYNYATELAYKNLADEDISEYFKASFAAITSDPPRDPDTDKSIRLVFASEMSYYDSLTENNDRYPVSIRNLMYDAQSDELIKAVLTIAGMRNDFYKIPVGEPKDKEPKPGRKKGKNS